MNIFFNQKVTGHVEPKNTKSHGTIIDICIANIRMMKHNKQQNIGEIK